MFCYSHVCASPRTGRALRAHLLSRPSREQLVARNVLPADPAALTLSALDALPLLLSASEEAVGASVAPPAWLRPASWSTVGGRAAASDGGGAPVPHRGRYTSLTRRSMAAALLAAVAAVGVGVVLHRREEWRGVLLAAAAAAVSGDGPGRPTLSGEATGQGLRDLSFDPAGYHPTTADAAQCALALLMGVLLWRRGGRGLGAALGLGLGGRGEGGANPSPNPSWGGANPSPAGGGPFYLSACVALLCASLAGQLGLSWMWLGLPLALLAEAHRAP